MNTRFKIITTVILVLLTASAVCWGKEIGFTGREKAKSYCETVMNLLMKGKNQEAFDLLKAEWLYDPADVQKAREQNEREQAVLIERFGQPVGIQLVKEEEVAGVGLKYTYLIRYEKTPIRWQFVFYKPKDRWLLNGFKWDSSFEALFER
jgi:hypothetical protein